MLKPVCLGQHLAAPDTISLWFLLFTTITFRKKIHINTGLFKMVVVILTTCHLALQMQSHMISFYGVTSRIRFMFLLFPQVSRNWKYESEPPLKPSPLTCYRHFGTNSIIYAFKYGVIMGNKTETCKVFSCSKMMSSSRRGHSPKRRDSTPYSESYCDLDEVKDLQICDNILF